MSDDAKRQAMERRRGGPRIQRMISALALAAMTYGGVMKLSAIDLRPSGEQALGAFATNSAREPPSASSSKTAPTPSSPNFSSGTLPIGTAQSAWRFLFSSAADATRSCETRYFAAVEAALVSSVWRASSNEVLDGKGAVEFLGFDAAAETNWPNYQQGRANFLRGYRCFAAATNVSRIRAALDARAAGSPPVVLLGMDPRGGLMEAFGSRPDCILALNHHDVSTFRPGFDISVPAPQMPVAVPAALPLSNHGRRNSTHSEVPRRFLATFRGRETHPVRRCLADTAFRAERRESSEPLSASLPDDVVVELVTSGDVPKTFWGAGGAPRFVKRLANNDRYLELMRQSTFALVPRGDANFSYRLLEALAAGAVPVVFSDGWVLPLAQHWDIHWSRMSVRIEEARCAEFIDILREIPEARARAMRAEAVRTYGLYFSSIGRQVEAMLEILRRREVLLPEEQLRSKEGK